MRILAVSDMHGDLSRVVRLIAEHEPELLLCCGDWGDPGQNALADCDSIVDIVQTYSVFGNHDDIELLSSLRNRDGSPILIETGDIREVGPITIAGINGIWAKSHREPWYITDEDVVAAAHRIGQADVLMTHGCAAGLADAFPGGRHGGQRCFLDGFKIVRPKVYLCGHLHARQMRQLNSGTIVVNVGTTAKGDYALLEFTNEQWKVESRGQVTGAGGQGSGAGEDSGELRGSI